MVISSGLAALLFGVAWANIVRGVPIDAQQEFTGSLFTLLNPYGLLGGVTTLLLFLSHGAIFLTMRTEGAINERAQGVARWASPAAAVVGIVFLVWTVVDMAEPHRHRGRGRRARRDRRDPARDDGGLRARAARARRVHALDARDRAAVRDALRRPLPERDAVVDGSRAST